MRIVFAAAVFSSALFLLAFFAVPAQAITFPTQPVWDQVNCGDGSGSTGGDNPVAPEAYCDYCDFVTFVSVVTQYMIYLGVVIAALAFAYAGWLYMTAGMLGTGQISQAHSIFTTVVFGIILMLVAYLVINFILAMTTSNMSGFLTHPWNAVTCPVRVPYTNAPVQSGNMPGGGTTGGQTPRGTTPGSNPGSLTPGGGTTGGPTSPTSPGNPGVMPVPGGLNSGGGVVPSTPPPESPGVMPVPGGSNSSGGQIPAPPPPSGGPGGGP